MVSLNVMRGFYIFLLKDSLWVVVIMSESENEHD